MADPAEGAPLFLDQNEAQGAKKNFLGDWDPPPPPPPPQGLYGKDAKFLWSTFLALSQVELKDTVLEWKQAPVNIPEHLLLQAGLKGRSVVQRLQLNNNKRDFSLFFALFIYFFT